jgi:hypothetical protein
VVDPYGCAIVTDPGTGLQTVSVYRRPLPTANLMFLSAIMFDGRETIAPLNDPKTFQANLVTDLMHQSVSATVTHAQGVTPTIAQQTDIVNFELGLFSAQLADNHAGLLNPEQMRPCRPPGLSAQNYYPGINDTLGADPTGAAFNPTGFTLYSSWEDLKSGNRRDWGQVAARRTSQREKSFSTHIP